MLGIKKTINKILMRTYACDLDEWVDLSTYTSSNNMYEFPCDGYVFAYNASNTSSVLTIVGNTDGGSTLAIGGQSQRHALYVRKGMKCYVTGTFGAVRFNPIVLGGGIS